MAPQPVALTIGTHTWNSDDGKIEAILDLMRKYEIKNLDTAKLYVSDKATLKLWLGLHR